MVDAGIGNVNHLSKLASLHCSCEGNYVYFTEFVQNKSNCKEELTKVNVELNCLVRLRFDAGTCQIKFRFLEMIRDEH